MIPEKNTISTGGFWAYIDENREWHYFDGTKCHCGKVHEPIGLPFPSKAAQPE